MSKMYEALRKAQHDGSGFPMPLESTPYATPEAEEHELLSAEEKVHPNGNHNGADMRRLPIRVETNSAVILARGLDHRVSEQYRLIRTKIVQHPAHPKMLIITSPGPGDGKTVSSLNIAGILALRDDAAGRRDRVTGLRRHHPGRWIGLLQLEHHRGPVLVGLPGRLAGDVGGAEPGERDLQRSGEVRGLADSHRRERQLRSQPADAYDHRDSGDRRLLDRREPAGADGHARSVDDVHGQRHAGDGVHRDRELERW